MNHHGAKPAAILPTHAACDEHSPRAPARGRRRARVDRRPRRRPRRTSARRNDRSSSSPSRSRAAAATSCSTSPAANAPTIIADPLEVGEPREQERERERDHAEGARRLDPLDAAKDRRREKESGQNGDHDEPDRRRRRCRRSTRPLTDAPATIAATIDQDDQADDVVDDGRAEHHAPLVLSRATRGRTTRAPRSRPTWHTAPRRTRATASSQRPASSPRHSPAPNGMTTPAIATMAAVLPTRTSDASSVSRPIANSSTIDADLGERVDDGIGRIDEAEHRAAEQHAGDRARRAPTAARTAARARRAAWWRGRWQRARAAAPATSNSPWTDAAARNAGSSDHCAASPSR